MAGFIHSRTRYGSPTMQASLVSLGLVVLVGVVYAPVLGNGFVNFDDPRYLTQNPMVQGGLSWPGLAWAFRDFHVANWHPLTWLSHMADVQLFGLAPAGHHLVSALIHAANSVLIFLVLRALTGAVWRSTVVAALFAVHPLHVESVAWLSERKDLLCAFFWLAGLDAWRRWTRDPTTGRMFVVMGAMALAAMSKPMAVTFPVTLVLMDIWPLGRLAGGRLTAAALVSLVREKWLLWGMSLATSVVTIRAQASGGAVSGVEVISWSERLGNAFLGYGTYLLQTAWPARLAAVYPHPSLTPSGLPWVAVAMSAVTFATLSALSIWQLRRRPHLFVGWTWFVVTLAPVIGIVQVGLQGHADRYTYIPHVGLFVALTWGAGELVASLRPPRAIVAATTVAGLLLLAGLARQQVATWRDSFTLFGHALEVTEENGLAWRNLGTAYQEAHRPDLAILPLRESLRLLPQDARTWMNLGIAQTTVGAVEEADACFEKALRMNPGDPFIWLNLGLAQAMKGDMAGLAQSEARLRILDPELAAELDRKLRRAGVPR